VASSTWISSVRLPTCKSASCALACASAASACKTAISASPRSSSATMLPASTRSPRLTESVCTCATSIGASSTKSPST
jgi:hypothetical protein